MVYAYHRSTGKRDILYFFIVGEDTIIALRKAFGSYTTPHGVTVSKYIAVVEPYDKRDVGRCYSFSHGVQVVSWRNPIDNKLFYIPERDKVGVLSAIRYDDMTVANSNKNRAGLVKMYRAPSVDEMLGLINNSPYISKVAEVESQIQILRDYQSVMRTGREAYKIWFESLKNKRETFFRNKTFFKDMRQIRV